jgi:hypothetical protein
MVQKIFRKLAQFRELQITYATLSNSKNRLTQFTIKRDERGEGEKKQGKKNTSETHQNSDNNTTTIAGKISTR